MSALSEAVARVRARLIPWHDNSEMKHDIETILAALSTPPAEPVGEEAAIAEMLRICRSGLLAVRDWQLRDERNNPNVPEDFEGSPFDYLRKLANDALKASARLAWGIEDPVGDWVVVPRTPTIEMLGAWWRQKNTGTQDIEAKPDPRHMDDCAAYAAMLAAAPQPPSTESSDLHDSAGVKPDGNLPSSTVDDITYAGAERVGPLIPADMKPWHGGYGHPSDVDHSKPVMRRDGTNTRTPVWGNQWLHVASHAEADIIAYTPKPQGKDFPARGG